MSPAFATVMLAAALAAGTFEVEQFGAMRAALREGRTEARVALAEVVERPGAVAVGALAGLEGEVTVLDGEVWVARTQGRETDVTGPEAVEGDDATLLTAAWVDRWTESALPNETPAGGGALEALVERAGRDAGVDVSRPFPFVIEGRFERLELHVINGFCPMGADPADMGAEPWRWAAEKPIEATVVGFFAPDAAGVMTHHGTRVHAHALVDIEGRTVTGHVEEMRVGAGATLRLPASSAPATP